MNKLYIKGFDSELKCRGYQFEVGKTYDTGHIGKLKLCTNTVFHFCESIQQVHNFYDCNSNNRFCYVRPLGTFVSDENKCGSNKLEIVREIVGSELNVLLGKTNGNVGIFNTGNRNTGDCNTGDYNTGDYNTGDYNTGDYNTGYRNTGDRNTGDYNTGDYNTCNHSTGFFNTKERAITIFNMDSGLTYGECQKTKWFGMLYRRDFKLTEWIDYTKEEKKDSIIRQCIGGYLKEYTYQEACANWWEHYTDEERKYLIDNIPNFNAEIFEEITGIRVNGTGGNEE